MSIKNNKSLFAVLGVFLLGFFVFSAGFSPTKAASGDWENVGSSAIGDNGYWPSLAFHPLTYEPYIAYRDNTNNWRATVKKFDGSSWSDVGTPGMSYASASYAQIAFNSSGEPYIAYRDNARSGKASVLKYQSSTNWQYVGDETFNDGGAGFLRLVFNPGTNEPYLAYADANSGGLAFVKKFNGTNWENVGTSAVSEGPVSNTLAMAFNSSTNEPYLAFSDMNVSLEAVVKKFNGSTWETVGDAGFSPTSVDFIDIAFNPSANEPYVVFADETNDENKATVMKFNGSSWEYVGNPQFSSSDIHEPSITFNPVTSEPLIAFGDSAYSDKMSVVKWNGSSWEQVGSAGFTEYSSGNRNSSFVFDPFTNEPFLVISGGASGNRISVWKYNQTSLSPANVTYSAKKTKRKVNFTFQNLNLSTKKKNVTVRINGKKLKISRARKSGVNTVASAILNHKKWARGSYDATISFRYKIGKTTRTKTWIAENILTIE
ncbi:MAG: hypothetical protein QMD77_04700 [Patescibacteria group bacterium]|nr:hypothetical protein [Patescibacteria group bacterium]